MKYEEGRSRWWSWQSRELRLLRKIVGIAVATFLGGYLIASLWMWAGAGRPTVVTVPNLRELTIADAERALDEYDLLLEVKDSLSNPEVQAGQVLTQSPLPGQEVAPGIAVTVIVSSGPERHAVPQVATLSREQAEQLLVATGLQPLVEEVTDARRAGRVIGTVPPAGTVLPVPGRIRLLVSSGPPLVAVPELVGMQEAELPGALGPAALRLGEVSRELRIVDPEGQVVAQQPAAGDSVPAGTPVDVVVATQRLEILSPEEIR